MCSFLNFDQLGQWRVAIDVIERQGKPQASGKVDKPSGPRSRHHLPALVMADVPLGAADGSSKRLLGKSKALANGLDVLHHIIMSPTNKKVNSLTVLN